MAEVKRTVKGRIAKGFSLNPSGLTKEVAELKKLTALTKFETLKVFHELSSLPLTKVLEISNDQNEKTVSVIVARIYAKAANGSLPHAMALLDRLIGPVPKNIQALDENGKPKDTQISMLQQIDSKALTQFVVNVQAHMKDITPCEPISPNE